MSDERRVRQAYGRRVTMTCGVVDGVPRFRAELKSAGIWQGALGDWKPTKEEAWASAAGRLANADKPG